MTKLSLYRRALAVAVASALGVAAFAAWWSDDFRRSLALIAALALGAAGLVAMRGRMWRPLGLLALIAAASFMAARAMLPWWALVPAALSLLGVALLAPSVLRRDRTAGVVASTLAALFGVQLGAGAEEALHWHLERPRHLAALELETPIPAANPGDIDPDRWRGRRAAEHDRARGLFREITYGEPDRAMELYRARLAADAIVVDSLTFEQPDTATIRYVLGYNEVMRAAIGKHRGSTYLDDQYRQASDAALHERR